MGYLEQLETALGSKPRSDCWRNSIVLKTAGAIRCILDCTEVMRRSFLQLLNATMPVYRAMFGLE
jgi:hypothetical protein